MLRVWLPLTGDLHNQGLSNVEVANTGAVVNNNGKMGKCYQFGTGTSYLELPASCMTSFTECSVAFWIKILSWNSNYCTFFQAGKNGFSWTDYIFGFLRNNNGSTVCFTIGNGSSASNASYLTSALELNTWYHITLTYKNGKCSIYLNGELDHEYSTTIVPAFDKITRIRLGNSNGSGYQTNCLMNDVRIYDHCLSLLEIKKISQGLVLHYPLSDKWIESTTNLITTEDCLSSTCFNRATNKYGYGTTSDIYKTVTTFDGRKGTKVYMGTNGNNCYPCVYISNMYTSDGTNSPAYKTLSFDYYTTISTSITPYKLGSGNGTATYIVTNKNGRKTGMGTNSVSIPVVPNTWNHIEITFHGTTAADSQWGYIQNQPTHISDTSNFWFFANMQLETKDHATGYAKYGTTRDENTIYDCSGFGNNGTKIGDIAWDNDSSRYSGSYKFDGASYIKNINFPYTLGVWSVSLWYCFDTIPTGYQGFICLSKGNGADSNEKMAIMPNKNYIWYKFENQSGQHNITMTTNKWTHLAITCDGVNGKVYINGVLSYTSSSITSIYSDCTDLVIGARSNADNATSAAIFLNGNMSDVRFYATALSADDILDLYRLGGSIDSTGTFHTYEYVEG